MTQTLLHDLLLILATGLIAGLVCRRLRISVLIGYLVAGVILGQGMLHWITDDNHQLEHFAEAGVFLLLFSIGIEFSLDELKRIGRAVFIGGAVQMTLVIAPVVCVLLWMEMAWQSTILVASAIAFSSTVLVFKALSECGHSEQPHGTRAIGILLFQDAALVPLLLLIPLLTGSGEPTGLGDYLQLAAVAILFVMAVVGLRYLLAKWIIPLLAGYRSPELVILFTIVSMGSVILAAYTVGLPPAVGAFAAGLIFNGNRWSKQIDSLVLPFRETFSAIFFVSLGLILDPRVWIQQPLLMLAMLSGVIAIKAGAAGVALRLTGIPTRHAIGMGLGMAHVGEFAFVLVLLGMESGVVSETDYQRVVSIAVGSLILTPAILRAGLRLIRPEASETDDVSESDWRSSPNNKAIVIGVGPVGKQIASQLELMGRDVCLIDLSPINLHPFAMEGFRTIAGDSTRRDILKVAGVAESAMIIVCVPQDDSAIRTVRTVRKLNRTATLMVRCRFQVNTSKLKAAGADRVVSEETEISTALLKAIAE